MATLDTISTENKPEIKLLIKQMNEQMKNLDEVSASLKTTSNEIGILFNRINSGEGTLGKLANDPALYNHLDGLVLQLQELIRNIDRDPKKYLENIDIKLF